MGSIDNIPEPSNLLFSPIKIGHVELKHRIALAPLTRIRATKKGHVPMLDLVPEYYIQRASTPGTFLITEGTFVAPQAGGMEGYPGIWNEEQMAIWKKVTEGVHRKGSHIYCQIWGLGRSADPAYLAESGYDYVSASNVPFSTSKDKVPRPLTVQEIKEYVQWFAKAAEDAIRVGFDGVEIHGANGYLIDQFISENTNTRTDAYGGSIANRSRFAIEIVEAVANRIGAERVGIRFSPYGDFQEMKQPNPVPQFSHLVSSLATLFPTLSYVHFVEPRVNGNLDITVPPGESLDFARKLWKRTGRPFLAAGGFTPENALTHMAKKGHENDVCVFGRWFIANPDLPRRIKENIPLNAYDRSTFYGPAEARGYIDYPFAA